MCKLNSIHRSCRKSDRKREGQLLFLIISVSYNARYAKLREVKNAHFPEFWRFSLSWLIFGLSSAVLHILQFLSYFMVLFVSCLQMLPVSHAYRCFLCYALLHQFICNSFYSSKHLCACFITFHVAAVVVYLFLCRHYVARFYGCSCMYCC